MDRKALSGVDWLRFRVGLLRMPVTGCGRCRVPARPHERDTDSDPSCTPRLGGPVWCAEQKRHVVSTEVSITSIVAMGALIQSRREALNLGQADLASLGGIDQANLSKIEQGRKTAPLGTYLRLLKGVGVDLRASFPNDPDRGQRVCE